MCKKLVLLSFLSMICLESYAQQPSSYGVRGGVNISNFTDAEKGNSKMGIHLGVFKDFKLNEKLSFQPELLYENLGKKDKVYDFERVVSNHYLSLPLLLKYRLIEDLSIEGGIQLAYLISSETFIDEQKADSKGVFNNNTSVVFGLSYNVTPHIFLTGRYNIGINPIYKETSNAKLTNIFLSLGYNF